MEQKSIYFPNLNSLRFIAALIVIVHHIEESKGELGVPGLAGLHYISGRLGVYLFFVLSGFLITYLLMAEQEKTNTISIKKFYIRRMLRIWPLYFLIVLSSLFIFPNIHILSFADPAKAVIQSNICAKLLCYVFFFPYLVNIFFTQIPFASVTWSIGVEEQFYLVWPWLIKYFKNKLLPLLLIIVGYRSVTFLLGHFNAGMIGNWWYNTPINCMAIGGLFSLICFNQNRYYTLIRKVVFYRLTQIIVFPATIYFLVNGFEFGSYGNEVYSTLFGIIIANLAVNPKRIIILEFGWLSYLGKISYGLYLYHAIFVVLVIRVLVHYNVANNLSIYSLSILSTIAMASLSYYFFEKPFISLKAKFSTIVSGLTPKKSN
jgi:peptidoglycan/LPS O-acetylase OafA/YrhL